MKAATRNVTLSIPESLLRRFRVYAATRQQSMSSLMEEAMCRMLNEDSDRAKAKRRLLERLRNADDLGTRGEITWTRDELYER